MPVVSYSLLLLLLAAPALLRHNDHVGPGPGPGAGGGVVLVGASQSASVSVEVGVDGNVDTADDDDGDAMTECEDENEQCPAWAERGECEANPGYMLVGCRKSCRSCEEREGGPDIGIQQEVKGDPSRKEKIRSYIASAEKYMREEVSVKPEYASVKDTCRVQHHLCAYWASIGECEANPGYMKVHCAPICGTCDSVDFEARCPREEGDWTDAIGPGGLDALFERVTNVTDPDVARYRPRVFSRPYHPDGIDDETRGAAKNYTIGPWVVTFEDFLTEEECQRLIELGAVEGYARSTDVGKLKFDGTYDKRESSGRTSSNAWCQHDCYNDPLAQNVVHRIADFTGIPEVNSEYLQLLRYEETQKYTVHHDFIPHHVKRAPGPRILTLFLYLNDVEAGGGTNFPGLGITVMPKRGKALLWPSVLNDDPNAKDKRTNHQALPVEKGLKYGANAWLHLRDFKGPLAKGCA